MQHAKETVKGILHSLNHSSTSQDTPQPTSKTMPLPKTYKAAVFESANSPFVLKDIELKHPSQGQVLVKVIATGVCHSDADVQSGAFGNSFPIIPGHEVIGDVAAVGDGEKRWKVGDRVGVSEMGESKALCTYWSAICSLPGILTENIPFHDLFTFRCFGFKRLACGSLD
jgi:hypothetical protein